MASTPTLTRDQISEKTLEKIRKPSRRGQFRDIDAARAQQALLTVADSQGQARLYWLIDLEHRTVADTRFLAFGSLASHAIMEVWSETVRGATLDEALSHPVEAIEGALRDSPETPAFGDAGLEPAAFVTELQTLAKAQIPELKILPKPVEIERYQRKRELDWDEHDRAWLPLSLMKKVMQVQDIAQRVIRERLGQDDVAWELDGVNDDFLVRITFTKGTGTPLAPEQRPIVVGLLESRLKAELHPQIVVEDVSRD